MVVTRFRELKLTRKVRVACAGDCGKKLARQQTFWQTLNPFNTNAEGQPKTGPEIYAELQVEADAWSPVAVCPACSVDREVRGAMAAAEAQVNG